MDRQSGFDFQNYLHQVPSDADPFAYGLELISNRVNPPLGTGTISLLALFLLFHVTIAGFCLIILVLPYIRGMRGTPWLWRKLYIRDEKGASVYRTPLYFTNASTLMTISQLLSSIFAQIYLWLQIQSAVSKQMIRSEFVLCLGLMNMFELQAYWSMTHCFLVTRFSTCRAEELKSSYTLNWITTPVVINTLLVCFPVAIIVTFGIFTGITFSVYTTMMSNSHELIVATQEGSSIWKQLHDAPSGQEQSQLAHLTPKISILVTQGLLSFENMLNKFRLLEWATFILLCISCLIFMYSFGKLAKKYQWEAAEKKREESRLLRSSHQLKGESHQQAGSLEINGNNPSDLRMLFSDQQFLRLSLRAFAILIGMLITITATFITVIRLEEVAMNAYWRKIATSLATVGSACTALPIAWQCWRLYVDQTPPRQVRSAPSSASLPSERLSVLGIFSQLEPKKSGSES